MFFKFSANIKETIFLTIKTPYQHYCDIEMSCDENIFG